MMLEEKQLIQELADFRQSQAISIIKWLLRQAIREMESNCSDEWKSTLLDIAHIHLDVDKLARAIEAREGSNRRKTDQ